MDTTSDMPKILLETSSTAAGEQIVTVTGPEGIELTDELVREAISKLSNNKPVIGSLKMDNSHVTVVESDIQLSTGLPEENGMPVKVEDNVIMDNVITEITECPVAPSSQLKAETPQYVLSAIDANQTSLALSSQNLSAIKHVSYAEQPEQNGLTLQVPSSVVQTQPNNSNFVITNPQPSLYVEGNNPVYNIPSVKNQSEPLGSTNNPIRIIQQGSQYTSMQQLSPEQLSQIMQVLQQQHLKKDKEPEITNQGQTIIYDPQTQSRVVYRVVQPSEIHGSHQINSKNANDSDLTESATKLKRGRGRPPGVGKTKQAEINKPTPLINNKKRSLSGDNSIEDSPDMPYSVKDKRKKLRPKTRSGRVSKPPKHMVKDYAHIHTLDWHEDYDDSDGGYSDYEHSSDENNSNEPKPSFDNYPSEIRSRHRFICKTCSKRYIGQAGLNRHFRLYPDHGVPVEIDPNTSALSDDSRFNSTDDATRQSSLQNSETAMDILTSLASGIGRVSPEPLGSPKNLKDTGEESDSNMSLLTHTHKNDEPTSVPSVTDDSLKSAFNALNSSQSISASVASDSITADPSTSVLNEVNSAINDKVNGEMAPILQNVNEHLNSEPNNTVKEKTQSAISETVDAPAESPIDVSDSQIVGSESTTVVSESPVNVSESPDVVPVTPAVLPKDEEPVVAATVPRAGYRGAYRGAYRGRGRRPKNSFMKIETPKERKNLLSEVIKRCTDEELIEVAMPRLIKGITLWEFLLMKVEKGRPSKARFQDVYKEFEALHKHVQTMCGQFIRQICQSAKGQTLEVTNRAVAESVGIKLNPLPKTSEMKVKNSPNNEPIHTEKLPQPQLSNATNINNSKNSENLSRLNGPVITIPERTPASRQFKHIRLTSGTASELPNNIQNAQHTPDPNLANSVLNESVTSQAGETFRESVNELPTNGPSDSNDISALLNISFDSHFPINTATVTNVTTPTTSGSRVLPSLIDSSSFGLSDLATTSANSVITTKNSVFTNGSSEAEQVNVSSVVDSTQLSPSKDFTLPVVTNSDGDFCLSSEAISTTVDSTTVDSTTGDPSFAAGSLVDSTTIESCEIQRVVSIPESTISNGSDLTKSTINNVAVVNQSNIEETLDQLVNSTNLQQADNLVNSDNTDATTNSLASIDEGKKATSVNENNCSSSVAENFIPVVNNESGIRVYQTEDGSFYVQNPEGVLHQIQTDDGQPVTIQTVQSMLRVNEQGQLQLLGSVDS